MEAALTRRLTAKGARTRGRILDAAEQLFSRLGFYGTSIREIAGALDMPTASLLHHYRTKERIYSAVLSRIADDLHRVMAQPLDVAEHDDASKLRTLCERYVDWTLEKPHYSNLVLRELLDNPARLAGAGTFHLAPLVERVAAFIAAGRAAGSLRDIDAITFIIHLAGSASYFCASRPTFERIASDRITDDFAAVYRRDLLGLIERQILSPEV